MVRLRFPYALLLPMSCVPVCLVAYIRKSSHLKSNKTSLYAYDILPVVQIVCVPSDIWNGLIVIAAALCGHSESIIIQRVKLIQEWGD